MTDQGLTSKEATWGKHLLPQHVIATQLLSTARPKDWQQDSTTTTPPPACLSFLLKSKQKPFSLVNVSWVFLITPYIALTPNPKGFANVSKICFTLLDLTLCLPRTPASSNEWPWQRPIHPLFFLLFFVVLGLRHCSWAFSSCCAQALGTPVSAAVVHGLNSRWLHQLQPTDSGVVAWGF